MALYRSFGQYVAETTTTQITEKVIDNFQAPVEDARGKRIEDVDLFHNPSSGNGQDWNLKGDDGKPVEHFGGYISDNDLYLWDRAKGMHKYALRAIKTHYTGNSPLWPVYLKIRPGGVLHVKTASYEDFGGHEVTKQLAERYGVLLNHPELHNTRTTAFRMVIWTPSMTGIRTIEKGEIQGMSLDGPQYDSLRSVIIRGPGKQSDDALIAPQAL